MANSSGSRSGKSTSRSTKAASSKKPARTTTQRSSARRTAPPVQVESGVSSLFSKFASSKAAKPLIFIAAVILITGIDLLVSWNKYEMFFKILGIEILIAVVVWVILTLVFSGRTKKDTDSTPVEDEV